MALRLGQAVAGGPGYIAWGELSPRKVSEGVSDATPPPDMALSGAPWASLDGVTWSPLPDPAPFAWGRVTSLTQGGPGLVAIGGTFDPATGSPAPAVWLSPDGLTWTRGDATAFGEGSPGLVTVGGGGPIAFGRLGRGQPAAWTSPDGQSWTLLPQSPGFVPSAVTRFGGGLVAVGDSSCPGPKGSGCVQQAAAWLSPPDLEP